MYLKTGDPCRSGGGTYSGATETEGTLAQYKNIFEPAGRNIKQDNQRHKRHQRWHLPNALKGHNQYLTDRVDGLITDATNSPFTRNILPYVYLENPNQKLKWNVHSFNEGIASRVPYEAAARVLPQTKRSFAGYTVRQGLAITMEHNFMVSAAGRENFKNQLTQLVSSIQLTNDLDVHVALLQALSYQKHMNKKDYDNTKTTAQMCRQYINLFGILQKVPNAMDILIEDAKSNTQGDDGRELALFLGAECARPLWQIRLLGLLANNGLICSARTRTATRSSSRSWSQCRRSGCPRWRRPSTTRAARTWTRTSRASWRRWRWRRARTALTVCDGQEEAARVVTPGSPLSAGLSDEGAAGSDEGLTNEHLTICYNELGYETRATARRNVCRVFDL